MSNYQAHHNKAALNTAVASAFPPDDPADGWRHGAACTADTAPLFFPHADLNPRTNRAHMHQATLICRTCPVVARCLDAALTDPHEPWGVLGGMHPRQLRELRHKLRSPSTPNRRGAP